MINPQKPKTPSQPMNNPKGSMPKQFNFLDTPEGKDLVTKLNQIVPPLKRGQ